MGARAGADDHLAPSDLQLAVYAGDDVALHALPPCGPVTIGRAEDNDVRIDNPSVSRKHCILHVGSPLRIEDLGGANGTFVRDPTAQPATNETQDLRQLSGQTIDVALGDCINLGTTMIVVRRTALPVAPPSDPVGATDATGVVVVDEAMTALYEQAYRAAASPISILILGETGVGKDVLAQAIHKKSPRARGPMLGLNCAALSESLLESELFGHEKGAFTGALQSRPGIFESCNGGTVFLDEVGELSLSIQAKILRVLADRTVMRLGARTAKTVDVRFLSATNRDLESAVANGTFRQDLYFRLNGISFTIPPLRQRKGEIEPLAKLFVEGACRLVDRAKPPALSPDAVRVLVRHDWPGNLRELRNVIDRAVVLCMGDTILPEHLPPKLTGQAKPAAPAEAAPPATERVRDPADAMARLAADPMEKLRIEMESLERQRIEDALKQSGGNQTQAAKLLGISRRTFVTRLDDFNIPRPRKGR